MNLKQISCFATLIPAIALISCRNDSTPTDAEIQAVLGGIMFNGDTKRWKMTGIQRGDEFTSEGGSIPKGTAIFPVRVYYTYVASGYGSLEKRDGVEEVKFYRNSFGEWQIDGLKN